MDGEVLGIVMQDVLAEALIRIVEGSKTARPVAATSSALHDAGSLGLDNPSPALSQLGNRWFTRSRRRWGGG